MRILELFAERHRLRLTRDAYGRRIVAGRGDSLIAEHGNGRLSVLLMSSSVRWWANRKRACVAAGCRLEQDGDTEGSLSFDPANEGASSAAITAAGCKRRRTPSAAQLEQLARMRATIARNTAQRAHNGAKTDDRHVSRGEARV